MEERLDASQGEITGYCILKSQKVSKSVTPAKVGVHEYIKTIGFRRSPV
jgi:hypothetical protein